ncbi:MAG: hypothetical protein HFJ33_05605 [Clostridia bacterium]|nr:hypothetical protein [Clostridia bacterium]
MERIGFSVLYFLIGYIVITWIGFLHTVFNIKVLKMKSMKESGGKGKGLGEAYNKTKPWHPLYNLIILPIFAYVYLKGLDTITLSNVIVTSIIWGTSAIVIDLVGWVLIKHPLSLTFRRFYIEYQPWITFVYLVMYASPFIAYWIIQTL